MAPLWLTQSTWPGSLAVQQVHDGLQYVVSILGHTAAGTGWHIACALHLAKDVTHLFDTLLNVWLEAGGIKGRSSDQTLLEEVPDEAINADLWTLTFYHQHQGDMAYKRARQGVLTIAESGTG